MNIYTEDTTSFNNNGLGFLTDVLSANVTDTLNGIYNLNIEYLVDGNLAEYLKEGNIIKTKVADGTYQLFRIKKTSKDFKTIKVMAQHIFYDLNDNFINNTYPVNLSAQPFLQHILDNTNFANSFTAFSDITDTKTARYVRRNPVSCIMGDTENSMVNLFGGELKRDNFKINFLSRVGNDNGVKLLFGKNITGINITIDITEMATRIMPQGFDGLLLPELYVDSPLINNYPTPKVQKIEYNDVVYDPDIEGAYHDIQDAYQELRRRAAQEFTNGIDKPLVNIKIDWIELSKTNEYRQYENLERVNIGDTITANVLGMDYETRVITTTYNVLTDRIEKYEIGTFAPSIVTEFNRITKSVDDINPTSILQAAQANATELITNAMGGYIYKTNSELYIMDTDDPTTATKVWRWNINGLGYSSTGINGPYGLAMTMDGAIVADFITTGTLNTNVIQGYGSLTLQVQDNTDAIGNRTGRTTTLTQDIDSIESQISDIADITTSATAEDGSIESTELQNIAVSYPIRFEIRPIIDNISYLYPSSGTFPSATTYLKVRKLRFTNVTTNDVFEYTLPDDLLYYDSDNYDSFIADYETNTCTLTKKCKYNADGSVSLLSTPTTTTYNYETEIQPYLALTEGDYTVTLPSYSRGFIFVRLMVLNAYTAQYATKIELNSSISQTAESITSQVAATYSTKAELQSTITQTANQITSEVAQTYATKDTTNALSTRISQSAKSISLTATDNSTSAGINIKLYDENGNQIDNENANITLSGLVKFTDLSTQGSTTINGSNITTGTINANLIKSGRLVVNGNYTESAAFLEVISPNSTSARPVGTAVWKNGITSYDYSTDETACIRTESPDGYAELWGSVVNAYGFNNVSLQERKKDFQKLQSALDILKDIDIYRYHYKTESKEAKKHIGVVIGSNFNYSEEITNQDNDSIDLYSFVAVCCQAIKEQQKEIEELKKIIKESEK